MRWSPPGSIGPIWNVLEGHGFHLVLANPKQVKALHGCKSDKRDSQRIAEFLQDRRIDPSFVPPPEIRRLRDELETRVAPGEQEHRLRRLAARTRVGIRRAHRARQRERDAAHVLIGLGAVLALAPRAEGNAHAAEGDHEERAHDRERDQHLEQREAARTPRHWRAPGVSGDWAEVRSVATSTERRSPHRTRTVIW